MSDLTQFILNNSGSTLNDFLAFYLQHEIYL